MGAIISSFFLVYFVTGHGRIALWIHPCLSISVGKLHIMQRVKVNKGDILLLSWHTTRKNIKQFDINFVPMHYCGCKLVLWIKCWKTLSQITRPKNLENPLKHGKADRNWHASPQFPRKCNTSYFHRFFHGKPYLNSSACTKIITTEKLLENWYFYSAITWTVNPQGGLACHRWQHS